MGFEPVKFKGSVGFRYKKAQGPHVVGGAFRHGFQMLLVVGLGVIVLT